VGSVLRVVVALGEAVLYRFADASRPGVLLGLSGRQATPLVIGVLVVVLLMQVAASPVLVLGVLGAAVLCAFGRVRGVPLAEVAAPALRLCWARWCGRSVWVRCSLLGAGSGFESEVPKVLDGLALLEVPAPWVARPVGIGVVHDAAAGVLTASLPVSASGFPLAAPEEQERMLAVWAGALAPFARERCAVTRVWWQQWSQRLGAGAHRGFLADLGVDDTAAADDEGVADYLGLVESQGVHAIAHEVLVGISVDLRRVRPRRSVALLDAGIEVLVDELHLFLERLRSAGLRVGVPLSPAELTAALRMRSDPTRIEQVRAVSSSLAAATGRGALEWGPMAVESSWGHVTVDGSLHRSYRVATWPMLPVRADWLAPLVGGAVASRTVTVVMEPVPTSRAARAADREVMAREADADMKERRGFRVSARDRKRMADVSTRERELAEGHPEFRFVGLVDVAAATLDELDDACAVVEQTAAQALVDLQPLQARHDQGWIASLPLGRSVAARVLSPT
jgi:hypothetical protein